MKSRIISFEDSESEFSKTKWALDSKGHALCLVGNAFYYESDCILTKNIPLEHKVVSYKFDFNLLTTTETFETDLIVEANDDK